MTYTVLEVARRLNISPHTIRYYGREGLLNFVERDEYGNRAFKDSDFEKLFIIASLKRTGMTIKQIRKFIELTTSDDMIAQRLQIITEQRELVESRITELNDALDVLKYKQWLYSTRLANSEASQEMPPHISKIKERIRRLTDNMEDLYK